MEIPKRRRGGLRRGRVAAVGALAASAVLAFGVGSAQATTHTFNATFDDAALNVGLNFDVLDPPNVATMTGTYDDGASTDNIDIPAGNFAIPHFSGTPLTGLNVGVDLTQVDPIVGTLDPATGALTTDPAQFDAVVAVSGLVTGTCSYTQDLAFSTAPGTPFSGDPFTTVVGDPTTISNGVIQEAWTAGFFPSDPSPACALVNTLVTGPGGLAFGNGADITPETAGGGSTPPAPVKKKKCKKHKKRSAESAKKKKCKKKKK